MLTLLIFCILTVALIVLPFIPAISEWRNKKDAEPLRLVRDSQVDIRHFAFGFREFVESTFGTLLEACRESQKPERGVLEDGTPYLVVGEGESPDPSDNELVLSTGDLRLAGNTMFTAEIYSGGTVTGGEKNVLRAVLAENDINLGRDSTTIRWLHGGRSVNVEKGCVLYGRVSADESIRIEKDCCFERLHAPKIDFYDGEEMVDPVVRELQEKPVVLNRFDITNEVEEAAGRWMVFGDLEIPDGKIVENDLVVTGRVELGKGVCVKGSIKSRKEMHLDTGVVVEGSVVCERDIHIDSGCRISGLVLSERIIVIHSETTIGSREQPTTVSGERIFIEPGVFACGTVWARLEGRVRKKRRGEYHK